MAATIQGVKGAQFLSGTEAWKDLKYQYATSSYEQDQLMDPALIIKPISREDIALTIKYAKEKKIAVSIRTGGHSYCGSSSTSAPNIQLDVSQTFQGPEDRIIKQVGDKTLVYTSISWDLGAFNKWLGQHKVFVPHGQCIGVGLGGHHQTGGFGQLGRSFGLFADHVVSIEMIDHAGSLKEVTKAGDPDLFWAILGGSPGNFGVVTHLWLEVYRDADYPGARGLKPMFWYDRDTLKNLLDILVEMSDNPDTPRNFDYCVSVLSSDFLLPALFPGIDEEMKREHPDLFGEDDLPNWPRTIVVYAQWVPFDEDDVFNDDVAAWFDRINDAGLHVLGRAEVMQKPMSELTAEWTFRDEREFLTPYSKLLAASASHDLGIQRWAEWVVGRVDEVVRPVDNWQWLSAQFQFFGGKHSKFASNANNGTSISWRDTTISATMDNFHKPFKLAEAQAWQQKNHDEAIGPNGKFSKDDRRMLWGPYGSLDLHQSRKFYYENEEKYEKLQQIRRRADPDGIFTPNAFCVKRAED